MKQRRRSINPIALTCLTFIVLLFGLVHCDIITALSNDIAHDNKSTSVTQNDAKPGILLKDDHWGLSDSIAVVGKLFQYNLTTENEKATNEVYQMIEDDEDKLPSWLYWNPDSNSVEGVAPVELKDQQIHIQLSAKLKQFNSEAFSAEIIKEYFSIKVLDYSSPFAPSPNPLSFNSEKKGRNEIPNIHCSSGSPSTTATIIFDADVTRLSSRDKVATLRSLTSFLGLPPDSVRILPSGSLPMLDSTALVAGPGDTSDPMYSGALAQWEVGCGNVVSSYMPVLELLELTASNGTLGKAIERKIIGWHITNNRPGVGDKRLKRSAYSYNIPTPTPIPGLINPAALYPDYTRTLDGIADRRHIHPVVDPSSMLKPPQLEIVVLTRTAGQGPVQPTKTPTTDPSRVPPSVLPTKRFEEKYKTTPSFESFSSLKPGDIEPSADSFTKSSVVLPTAALPLWTKYNPDEISYTLGSPPDSDLYTVITQPSDVDHSASIDMFGTKPVTNEFDIVHTDPLSLEFIPEKSTRRPPKTPKPPPEKIDQINSPPELLNTLPNFEIEAGRFLLFPIPSDTFYDREDGPTGNLTLLILTDDGKTLQPTFWLNLNKTNQVLYGLPLNKNIGVHRFVVAAIDSYQQIAKSPIEITVLKASNADRLSHEFSITLDYDFQKFIYDLGSQFVVINKIAHAFGDDDSRKMTITRISEGSVEIRWTNNTIPVDPCPKELILAMSKYLVYENGTLNKTFVQAMRPYSVISAGTAPRGSCLKDTMPPHTTDVSHKDKFTPSLVDQPEIKKQVVRPNNLLLYIVIAIVIFVVLLLICIIICIACYKRQRRRREKEGNENEKLSGLHKGIPIIFADELEDPPTKFGDLDATPASTLRSGKSKPDSDSIETVPPPEYPRSKQGSAYSTLRSDWKEPLLSSEDEEPNANEDRTPANQQKNEESIKDIPDSGPLPSR